MKLKLMQDSLVFSYHYLCIYVYIWIWLLHLFSVHIPLVLPVSFHLFSFLKQFRTLHKSQHSPGVLLFVTVDGNPFLSGSFNNPSMASGFTFQPSLGFIFQHTISTLVLMSILSNQPPKETLYSIFSPWVSWYLCLYGCRGICFLDSQINLNKWVS